MKSPAIHLLIALAASVIALLGYVAWYGVVSDKSREVAGLQNQILAASETVSRVASARAALTEIAGDEMKVRSYFVPESGIVAFINDLEARGVAQGATIAVSSVSTGGTPSRPALVLSITVKGTFDAVMRAVGSIEYAPYDILVSSFSIRQDVEDIWNANLGLRVGSVLVKAATSTP